MEELTPFHFNSPSQNTSHIVIHTKFWYNLGFPNPPKGNQVKHLLILLISILLLSSPVIGEETGVLYLWENGTKYMGEWKDGKKHGQGTYTSGKGEGEGDKYVGEFKGGFKNGHGKYIWSNGDEYVGEFKDDKPNGQGTYTWSDGDKYVGEFKDGKKHGQGTWTSIKGYKYVGEWRENKSWNGKEYDKKGNIIGKYVNGKYNNETPSHPHLNPSSFFSSVWSVWKTSDHHNPNR